MTRAIANLFSANDIRTTIKIDLTQTELLAVLSDFEAEAQEWVEDCYVDGYAGAPSDGAANTSGDCVRRVVRGGSWSHFYGYVRAASRGEYTPGVHGNGLGFRVAS